MAKKSAPAPASPNPFAGIPEVRIPFGPQVLARKIGMDKVHAKIRASRIDPSFFEVTPQGSYGVLVRAKIRSECALVIQEIADEDAAAAASS